jgi:hypothetical protein
MLDAHRRARERLDRRPQVLLRAEELARTRSACPIGPGAPQVRASASCSVRSALAPSGSPHGGAAPRGRSARWRWRGCGRAGTGGELLRDGRRGLVVALGERSPSSASSAKRTPSPTVVARGGAASKASRAPARSPRATSVCTRIALPKSGPTSSKPRRACPPRPAGRAPRPPRAPPAQPHRTEPEPQRRHREQRAALVRGGQPALDVGRRCRSSPHPGADRRHVEHPVVLRGDQVARERARGRARGPPRADRDVRPRDAGDGRDHPAAEGRVGPGGPCRGRGRRDGGRALAEPRRHPGEGDELVRESSCSSRRPPRPPPDLDGAAAVVREEQGAPQDRRRERPLGGVRDDPERLAQVPDRTGPAGHGLDEPRLQEQLPPADVGRRRLVERAAQERRGALGGAAAQGGPGRVAQDVGHPRGAAARRAHEVPRDLLGGRLPLVQQLRAGRAGARAPRGEAPGGPRRRRAGARTRAAARGAGSRARASGPVAAATRASSRPAKRAASATATPSPRTATARATATSSGLSRARRAATVRETAGARPRGRARPARPRDARRRRRAPPRARARAAGCRPSRCGRPPRRRARAGPRAPPRAARHAPVPSGPGTMICAGGSRSASRRSSSTSGSPVRQVTTSRTGSSSRRRAR